MATEDKTVPAAAAATTTKEPFTWCRRKKNDDAAFLEDLKDHIDEFISASMEEHKICFKKSIQKMFGMSKVVAERNSSAAQEVESSLPLKTVVSEKKAAV